MRRGSTKRESTWLMLTLVAVGACTTAGTGNDLTNPGASGSVGGVPVTDDYGNSKGGGVPADDEPLGPSAVLDKRVVDYSAALRSASLKLVGEMPTLAEIQALDQATDKKAAYAAEITRMLADPRFSETQLEFWRNTFKTGGENAGPSFETAATFAAKTVVEDRAYTELFTASSGTCPTYDAASNTFTAADCGGSAPTAGVLTDPGLMAQYYAALAFRRVRFVQETFVCSQFPAEYSATPSRLGAGIYTGTYDVTSISGKLLDEEARLDFHEAESTVCANCHSTMNHIAPLFAYFDAAGAFNAAEVQVFLPDESRAIPTDWLPAGEPTSWRQGKPVASLPELGQAMAADEQVARCAVTRFWNFAFSRGNVVDDASPVSAAISDPLLVSFKTDFKVKKLIHAIFTSDDFTKF